MSSVPIACFYFLSSFYSFSFLLSCRISPSFFLFAVHLLLFLISFSPTIFFISSACLYLYSLLHLCFYSSFFWSAITFSFCLLLISILFVISVSQSLHPPSLHFFESISLQKLLSFLIAEYCFFNLPFLLFPCCTFPLYRMRFADQ